MPLWPKRGQNCLCLSLLSYLAIAGVSIRYTSDFRKILGYKLADNFTNTPAHERLAMKVESTRASPELPSGYEDGVGWSKY